MKKLPSTVTSGITRVDVVDRLRRQLGVRGMPSLQLRPDVQPVVVTHDLTDAALVTDPVYYAIGGRRTALAGQVPDFYIQGRAPRTVIDGIIVCPSANAQISIRKVGTGTPQTRQSQITNRGNGGAKASVAQLTMVEQDIGALTNADALAMLFVLANTPYLVPLPPIWLVPKPDGSLFDTIEIQSDTVAGTLLVTVWGREYQE